MKTLLKYLPAIIVVIAFVLRFYGTGMNPPSMSWDEVSIGYNAYSILKTGYDEHHRFMPFDTFVAYGDYKPPVPVYLTVPSIAVFGLTETGVRFPSILLGSLTVLFTYYLVRELFRGRKNSEQLALLSAAVLAVSPWHINLSRAGFEAVIALFFVVLGSFLVLKARWSPKIWPAAWIPFAVSVYTFNSARYFVPLLGLGLIAYCWKSIGKSPGRFLIGVCIAAALLLPIVPHLLSKEARLRFVEVNIFTDPAVVNTSNARIAYEHDGWWAKLLQNRRVGYIRSYAIHFLDNLEPWFLFVKGDGNPKFSIQDVGQLYLMEAPLLLAGILFMFAEVPGTAVLLVFWLLAAIVPAATARETPHALRILNSLPTWHIFIAYGILRLKELLTAWGRKNVIRSLAVAVAGILFVFGYGFHVLYYLHTYYAQYPVEFSGEWQYGYREAFMFVEPIANAYDHVYVTDAIGRPYMYALFYTKTDPKAFWETKRDFFDASGFYHVTGFGRYEFVSSIPDVRGKNLYVAGAGSQPPDAQVLKTIPLLNGEPKLVIYER